MGSGAVGRRRRIARPLARALQPARAVARKRPLGRGLIVTHKLEPRGATSLPTRTWPPSRGVGPRPQSTRLRTQTGRVPPLAQRRLGFPRSPSQGQMRLADESPNQGPPRLSRNTRGHLDRGSQAGHDTDPAQRLPGPHRWPSQGGDAALHRQPIPGPPRLDRGQRDRGRRRTATHPRRNGGSETPVAQPEGEAIHHRRPIRRAAASHPRSTRPRAQALAHHFCLTRHFIFSRSIVIAATLWRIFSAPPPPPAASPLPLPVGLSGRIRA